MKRAIQVALGTLAMMSGIAAANEAPATSAASLQSRDDAWWTGPILAASASTLPQGHFLIEPYVYDAITYGRYDEHGARQSAARENDYRSLTYWLYGLTDKVTVGLISRFGFNQVSQGQNSSGVGLGDTTVQAQYRLTQFREGHWLPTTSLVLQETLPSGKYDRLADRPNDGFGSGAHTTTLSIYTQDYFWLPNGRILRTRLDLSYSFSDRVGIEDVSVYGTDSGFRGHAWPGSSFVGDVSWEYGVTRNWVVALDIVYEHDGGTRIDGYHAQQLDGGPKVVRVERQSGTSDSLGFAPAIEYNWSGNLGVIVGAKLTATGRNTSATVIPVAAINIVY